MASPIRSASRWPSAASRLRREARPAQSVDPSGVRLSFNERATLVAWAKDLGMTTSITNESGVMNQGSGLTIELMPDSTECNYWLAIRRALPPRALGCIRIHGRVLKKQTASSRLRLSTLV